eukprot:CAMPEP_0168364540 /NCGR_PEP_ID=MMETSP0228-20121227/4260_1 /TAXON_ID=133427 /ORGANISM="Protoceratium reticulatum, Strain CCCM 535 (=CCMP 1889)" /LENGTH=588 /DNA_ID=CAMNT_0008377303 /DNA_START=24 /DNA_END=1790 /DNA_ORIENTATION=+
MSFSNSRPSPPAGRDSALTRLRWYKIPSFVWLLCAATAPVQIHGRRASKNLQVLASSFLETPDGDTSDMLRNISSQMASIDNRLSRIEEGRVSKLAGKFGGSADQDPRPVGKLDKRSKMMMSLEQERVVASTTACLLMGFLALTMCVLYLLNFPDRQVRNYSYKMLSACFSILCAVLIEKAQFGNLFQKVIFKKSIGRMHLHAWPLLFSQFALDFTYFGAWLTALSYLMMKFQNSRVDTYAWSHLVSHEVAFVGIQMFAAPQATIANEKQKAGAGFGELFQLLIGFTLGSALFLVFVLAVAKKLRHRARHREAAQASLPEAPGGGTASGEGGAHAPDTGHGDLQHEGGHHSWPSVALEGELEACAIILSLLTRQVILLFITGRVPSKKGDFEDHTFEHFCGLFVTIFIVVLLIVVVTKLTAHSEHHHEHSMYDHVLEFVFQYLSFLLAWVLIAFCTWSIQSMLSDKTLMFTSVAAAVTFPLMFFVITLDFLCDHGWLSEHSAEVFIEACGLTIGISWEKSFAVAIDTINGMHNGSIRYMVSVELGLCLGLCLMVLPAWRAYIAPHAAEPVPARGAKLGIEAAAGHAAH